MNKYKIQPIITQDIHYVEKEDIEIHETIFKLRRKQKEVKESEEPELNRLKMVISDETKRERDDTAAEEGDDNSYFYTVKSLYFKSYEELKESWKKDHSYIPENVFDKAIDNTEVICNQIEYINVRNDKPQIPQFNTGELTSRQFILKLIKEGAERKLAKKVAKKPELKEVYESRMKYELNSICELNFEQYFLIVWDIINWCKQNDIMTGCGRGSAAGSLIAYLLDITDIDPIQHNLLFERFINKSRSGALYKIVLDDFPIEKKE